MNFHQSINLLRVKSKDPPFTFEEVITGKNKKEWHSKQQNTHQFRHSVIFYTTKDLVEFYLMHGEVTLRH
jgi:hypothetical protein